LGSDHERYCNQAQRFRWWRRGWCGQCRGCDMGCHTGWTGVQFCYRRGRDHHVRYRRDCQQRCWLGSAPRSSHCQQIPKKPYFSRRTRLWHVHGQLLQVHGFKGWAIKPVGQLHLYLPVWPDGNEQPVPARELVVPPLRLGKTVPESPRVCGVPGWDGGVRCEATTAAITTTTSGKLPNRCRDSQLILDSH
jgi:hypothetical protein